MQNKKTNWWALVAIVIIGVPLGFVLMGVLNRGEKGNNILSDEDSIVVVKKTLNMTDSIADEKEEKVISEPVSEPKSNAKEDIKSEDVHKKDDEAIRIKKLYANVKPNSLVYGTNGGNKTISISSNTNWQVVVTGSEDWLTPSTTSGSGNKTVSFVAQENKMTSQRVATIEVKWKNQDDDEQTDQIKVSQAAYVPVPDPITVAEAQSIVASGRADSRIPDNCKVEGNGVNTTYKQFRKNVAERNYESVKVESVIPDKKGIANRLNVKVVRRTAPVENVIKPDKTPPVPKKSNPVLSNDEAQVIVSSGKASSMIPEGCKIVLNGKTTNYQNFRNGVKLGSYSDIKVTKVEDDGKTVNAVYVTAKVKSGDD